MRLDRVGVGIRCLERQPRQEVVCLEVVWMGWKEGTTFRPEDSDVVHTWR